MSANITPSDIFTEAFDSRDDLIAAVKAYGIARGYAVTTDKSTGSRNIRLHCDHGGHYKNGKNALYGAKHRITTTRRIGCPFYVYASVSEKKSSDRKWRIKNYDLTHSHKMNPEELILHPSIRRACLTDVQKHQINTYIDADIKPTDVADILRRQWPDILITPQDISNIRKASVLEKLAGRSPVEFLLSELDADGWFYKYKTDTDRHITFLIFAHPDSIKWARKYHMTFVCDCTYKTNIYEMPLLHITTNTPSGSTFSIAFCLMLNEKKEAYQWALKTLFEWIQPFLQPPVMITDRDLALIAAIEEDFPLLPHLLCLWHINQAVLRKCKKFFVSDDDDMATQINQNEEWEEFFAICRPGFAPPRGAESQNLHRTSRGAGADFRTSTNPEGREGRWRVTLIDPHKPAFA